MSFQPLGYRFEVRSSMHRKACKAAIRGKAKAWLDVKRGARGWIAGPFICLWLSAFDKNGPMLFGVISDDGQGTRIRGRAGSDLNGVLMLLGMSLVVFLAVLASDDPTAYAPLLFAGLFSAALIPLILWLAHKDRRNAEPLVRFLEQALTPSKGARRPEYSGPELSRSLVLDVGYDRPKRRATASAVHDALLDIAEHEFVILEAGTAFIQSVESGNGYSIEFREIGGGLMQAVSDEGGEAFPFAETFAAFLAFGSNRAMPPQIRWKPVRTRT